MKPRRRALAMPPASLTVLLLCCATAFAQPTPTGNIITNPGFEDGLSGWETVNPVGGAAKVEIATEGAFSVRAAVHVANTNAEDLRPVGVRQVVRVSSGAYSISVRSKNTALKSSGGVRVTAFDASGKRLSRAWPVQLHTWKGGWALAERTIAIPKNAARVELLLSVNGLGEAWFDEVSFARAKAAPNPAEQKAPQLPVGITVTRYATPSPVFTIAAADLDGDGDDEVLAGGLDNSLRLFDDGEAIWRFDLGGLPCDIACGDANGDGRLEIAAATMDESGDVFVISPDGKRLWTHSVDDNRCSRVAWADLAGDGARELLIGSGPVLTAFDSRFQPLWEVNVGGPRLSSLTAADIDGDGRDEVLAGYEAQTMRVIAVDGNGKTMWRYTPSDWPGGATVSSILAADINGDGALEVVGGSERRTTFALRADGSLMWRGGGPRRVRDIALAEPLKVTDAYPGVQVLLMGRRSLGIRAGSGPEIFSTDSGLIITDSAPSPTDARAIYVASSGLRDPAFYRLQFSPAGENSLASYALPDPIGANLDAAYEEATAVAPRPMPAGGDSARKFHILLYRNARQHVEAAWPLLKSRATPNVTYEILSYVKELPVELNRFPMTSPSEILEYVRFFEREKIPFYLFVDHGCRPWISLETASKILDAAPTSFRGFYCAEDNYDYPGGLCWSWLKWAEGLLDLCHARGKKVIFKEMYDCWSLLASDPRVYDALFKYPETIIPMFATNNAHAPEIQIGGMLGLWRAGACDDWGMSSQHWNWNWEDSSTRVDYSTVCPPDIILRMDLAAASLGCTYFHVEGGQAWLDNQGNLQPEARRHRELLYQLMERNLVLPVGANQLEGLSPVAIARTTDPSRAEGAKIGIPRGRIGTPFRNGLLGVRGALQTTPPDYLPAYAYGLGRFFDGLFPPTPYGYIQLAPAFAPGRGSIAKTFIDTGTEDATVAGKRLSAEEARPVVLDMLEKAAEELPFRCNDAFLSVQKWGDEHRLILIDPGYLRPLGESATVRANLPGAPASVTDLLTGKRVAVQGNAFTVDVPAGGFRLILGGR